MATVAAAGGQPSEYPHQEEDEVNYDEDEELEEAAEEEAQEGANANEPRGGNQVPADRKNRQRNNNNRRNNKRPHPRRGDRRQGRERHAPYQRRHHPRVGTPPRDLRQQLNNNRQGSNPVPAPAGAPSGGASALLQAIQLLVGYSLGAGASSATG
jgi:hypothetical protein